MEHIERQVALPKSITILGFMTNLLLAVCKGAIGIIAQSSALIADAGHSLSDLFSDIITYWSIHFSQQPKDENHPYGHGRFETVGSFIIALMLVATGIGVVWHTIERIEHPVIPGELALWGAGISIFLKESLFQLTYRIGKKQNSRILIANAWHHRTDAISSIAALIGILGAILGFPLLDPIAGFLVAGLIIKSGIDISVNDSGKLSFSTKRNLLTNSAEFYNLSYEYINDCLKAGIVFRREFYTDRDIEPDDSIMFKISILPFGNLNSPTFSK